MQHQHPVNRERQDVQYRVVMMHMTAMFLAMNISPKTKSHAYGGGGAIVRARLFPTGWVRMGALASADITTGATSRDVINSPEIGS